MTEHSFDIEVAQKYGIACAILIKHFSYWIAKNIANETNFFDGRYWTYNSIKAFEQLFPYMTSKQIRSTLKKLEDENIIMSGNYNKSPYDRTKWYAFTDYGESLAFGNAGVAEKESSILPNGKMENLEEI